MTDTTPPDRVAPGPPIPPRLSIEDLRPSELDDVMGQEAATTRLRAMALAARDGHLVPPNLILHGPPGVGKTTAARAFGRLILGEAWENGFHQLDGSDDRGADFIKNRIFPTVLQPPSRGAPVRIVFLDEAEELSRDAQFALRPLMEARSRSTVFLLSCNDLGALQPALRSRCLVLEFSKVSDPNVEAIARAAARRIALRVPEARWAEIVRGADGVPRNAILRLVELAAGGPSPEGSARPAG